jgi:Mitochondrial carrier protein
MTSFPWTPLEFNRPTTGLIWTPAHDIYLPSRIRALSSNGVPLDAGSSIFEREHSLRSVNMHKALGLDSNLWQMISDRVYASTYDASRIAFARLDVGLDADGALVHYGSMAIGFAASAAATQPLSVVQSVQTVQVDAPIGFFDCWKLVRANEQKSLWDGGAARFLHCFASCAVRDVAKATLFNAFGVRRSFECHDGFGEAMHAGRTHEAIGRSVRRHALAAGAGMLLTRVAHLIADLATSPLATVRCRLECQHALPLAVADTPSFDSTLHCFRAIAQREGGWRAFFRGVDHVAYGAARDLLIIGGVVAGIAGLGYALTSAYSNDLVRASISVALLQMAIADCRRSLARAAKDPVAAELLQQRLAALELELSITSGMIDQH